MASIEEAAYAAARKGYIAETISLIDRGARDIDYMTIGAAEGGYRELLSLLTGEAYERLSSNFPGITQALMSGATLDQLRGDLALREEYRALPPEILAEQAVKLHNIIERRQHDAAVQRQRSTFIPHYANDFDSIAYAAARHGYTDIVNMYLPYVSDINLLAYRAAEGGYELLVMNLIGRGANDLTYIAVGAAKHGHKGLVDKLAQMDEVDMNIVSQAAKQEGYTNF